MDHQKSNSDAIKNENRKNLSFLEAALARSLFLGINNYFKENLEDDFFIYDAEGHLTYTVQRGDVLSEIAIRFGVPVMDIINTNLIRDEAIFPGQRIKIKI